MTWWLVPLQWSSLLRKFIVFAVLVVAACAPAKFYAVVELDPSTGGWTPTHFGSNFVERESVSRVDEWPRTGDMVEVLCQEKGGEVLNPKTNELDANWLKIIVPPDKIDDAATKQAEEVGENYVGYLPVYTVVKVPDGLPNCRN